MQALDQQQVHCAAASRRHLTQDRKLRDRQLHKRQPTELSEKGCVHFRTNPANREINLRKDPQISSMRALLVLPLLLCAVVLVQQGRAEVKGVKLCGREFLRAVVYTCGGSRWRRFLSERDMDGDVFLTGEQNSLESLSSSNLGSQFSRRDMNNYLTTVCCQVGCKKSDLTFLC